MKSYIAKPSDIDRKWYVIDAEGKTLGKRHPISTASGTLSMQKDRLSVSSL